MLKLVGKTLLAFGLVAGFSQISMADTVPSPAQGQHLTRKHRVRYVTGKPLFSVPADKTTRIVTYTPEDLHELVVNNTPLEKVTFHEPAIAE